MYLEYVYLPNTDLKVSRIAFGCEILGGTDWGNVDIDLASAAVRYVLDQGINVFDTADVYGLGQSEEQLSRILGMRRRDVVIITKCGVRWELYPSQGRAKTWYDSTPEYVRTAMEASLKRLKIDCIPLYLIHWPDPKVPIEDTVEVLLKCQRVGKIRYWGLSNFPQALVERAHSIGTVAALEVAYNLANRACEVDPLPVARKLGLGVFAYGVLAQGLLTGKYSNTSMFDPSDRRHRLPWFQPEAWPKNQQLLNRISRVAAHRGKSIAQVAIRWVLDQPGISSAIIGARSADQVAANLAALGWKLSESETKYLAGEVDTPY